jgi:hypothetical protein
MRRCTITIAFEFFFRIYFIRKVQENKVGLTWNGTHQLLVYADVNLLRDHIYTIKKNRIFDYGVWSRSKQGKKQSM